MMDLDLALALLKAACSQSDELRAALDRVAFELDARENTITFLREAVAEED